MDSIRFSWLVAVMLSTLVAASLRPSRAGKELDYTPIEKIPAGISEELDMAMRATGLAATRDEGDKVQTIFLTPRVLSDIKTGKSGLALTRRLERLMHQAILKDPEHSALIERAFIKAVSFAAKNCAIRMMDAEALEMHDAVEAVLESIEQSLRLHITKVSRTLIRATAMSFSSLLNGIQGSNGQSADMQLMAIDWVMNWNIIQATISGQVPGFVGQTLEQSMALDFRRYENVYHVALQYGLLHGIEKKDVIKKDAISSRLVKQVVGRIMRDLQPQLPYESEYLQKENEAQQEAEHRRQLEERMQQLALVEQRQAEKSKQANSNEQKSVEQLAAEIEGPSKSSAAPAKSRQKSKRQKNQKGKSTTSASQNGKWPENGTTSNIAKDQDPVIIHQDESRDTSDAPKVQESSKNGRITQKDKSYRDPVAEYLDSLVEELQGKAPSPSMSSRRV